jgi:hypothetical protein
MAAFAQSLSLFGSQTGISIEILFYDRKKTTSVFVCDKTIRHHFTMAWAIIRIINQNTIQSAMQKWL